LQGFVEVLQLGYKPLIRSHLRPFASNYWQGTFEAHLMLLHEICNNNGHTVHFYNDNLVGNPKKKSNVAY
jgi:hypothetical protein